MEGLINVGLLLNSILYAFLGVIIFWLSFLVIDRITPYNLWKEVIEEHNTALAIIVGAMALGISVIVAAAIH